MNWLEAVASDRALEYEEIRGYHLEQAFLIRKELAAIDDHVKVLGRRAAAHLSSAGRRALARGDLPAAANLLQRAAALLPRDDPVALGHMIDVGEALLELGEFSGPTTSCPGSSIARTGSVRSGSRTRPGCRDSGCTTKPKVRRRMGRSSAR